MSATGRFKTQFTDFTDTDEVRRVCLLHRPKIIWVETPSNPLLRITDIRAMSTIARECGSLLFTLAESLGGVESLVCHPSSMTHAAMTEQAQIEAGIKTTLLRLSVGIEHTPDLVSDISSALACANRTGLGVVSYG